MNDGTVALKQPYQWVDPVEPQVNERVKRYRSRRRAAGLRRVEVLVPEDKADLLRAYAAELREGSDSEALVELRKLIKRAYAKFHASCLDNISIDPESANFSDGAIVAAALMHRGNAEAFKLGRKIQKLSK